MITEEKAAEIMLDTAALGYAAIVQACAPEQMHEAYCGALEHLHHSALSYAATRGDLAAAERAELLALRWFRDGIVALRGELVEGLTSDGEAICDANSRHFAVESIDAVLAMCDAAARSA